MVFMRTNTLIYISISFLLSKMSSSFIFLPFNKRQHSPEPTGSDFTADTLVEYYVESEFYTTIEMGTPPQKVELILSSDRYGLTLIEDKNSTLNNTFDKYLSSSLDETDEYDSYFSYRTKKPTVLKDSIFLDTYDKDMNKLSKVKVEEYPFVYLSKKEGREAYENTKLNKTENGKAYMLFGTKPHCNWQDEIAENIPYHMKHLGITNSYVFNVVFSKNKKNENENYDLSFIIGNEPHISSPDKFDTDNLMHTNLLKYAGELKWLIDFDEVFYFPEGFKINQNNKIDDLNQISTDEIYKEKKIIYSDDFRSEMTFNLDIILCPKFFYFSIDKIYFRNHTDKCEINFVNNRYSIFVCDKDFNTENFSSIYFYHKELNHTFILTEKDLFKIKGNKKYFLIIYDKFRPSFWLLGKIFLEKYLFNFDMESKRIGFYKDKSNIGSDSNNEENSFNKILLTNLIWLLIVIVTGIVGFLIGKKLYKSIRKKRAFELDDNYDYTLNGENNSKDKEKLNENDNDIEGLVNNKIIV